MELYETALKLAAKAHEGQHRKHDESAYIAHPIMVARILEQACFSEIVVAAGIVHDVLEDTEISEGDLRSALGDEVVGIVVTLSENKLLEWEERKQKYVESVVTGGESVWAVSVADKIHNARELISFHEQRGAQAWQVFNRGKKKKLWFEHLLYNELKKVWEHPLLEEYNRLIKQLELAAD